MTADETGSDCGTGPVTTSSASIDVFPHTPQLDVV
jgi:hypothetical protein